MTDLTTLHSPSTLYLPLAKETGLPRRFNRRSTLPIVSTPLVTVQMADTDPPPPSPVRVRDTNLLSPPPHTFRSRPRARRPPSTYPEENTRSIRSPNYSSLHPKSPESVPKPSRRSSTLIVAPPPTTIFRPKPFWRNTSRSAVTGTSYASSQHPIRRSTFIAAGLRFDKPIADLSALGVESRIGIVVLLPDTLL
ncbi:hypothetical protein EDB87DRAFT_1627875 [Lactarius vividus]|nr:hypothetical protein EDB87DRAFT_1627875 [Lactarius vividus]